MPSKLYLLILFLFISFFGLKAAQGQEQIGIYACGFTIHVGGDPNAQLMPLRLDEKGRFLVNYGVAAHYKNYFRKRFSFDIIQTIQADCALLPSLGSNISIGYDIIQRNGHRFILAIGPGLYIRESWTQFPSYKLIQDFRYSKNGKWEYMVFPIVPHIEYVFRPIGKKFGFTLYGIVDPIDRVYNFGMGVSYQFRSE